MGECLTAFGGRWSADGGEGDVFVEVDGESDAAKVDTKPLEQLELDPRRADHGSVLATIPFTGPSDHPTSPIGAILAQFQFRRARRLQVGPALRVAGTTGG